MASRSVTNEQQREMLIRFIQGHKLPFTADIVSGQRRSNDQNRLQRKWVTEIAEQLGETAEYWRAYCKLHFGVPILRAENEVFCEAYDRHVKGQPYEVKMAFMAEPFDFAVTRLMSTKQKSAYLDQIYRHFAEQGVVLTDPEMMRMEGK